MGVACSIVPSTHDLAHVVLGGTLVLAGLGVALASSCTLGADTAVIVTDAGPDSACDDLLRSCAPPYLCVSNLCRTRCTRSAECGQDRCLTVSPPDGGAETGVCVDHASMQCSQNCVGNNCQCPGPSCYFCPTGSQCAPDQQCRNMCGQGPTPAPCANGDACLLLQGQNQGNYCVVSLDGGSRG